MLYIYQNLVPFITRNPVSEIVNLFYIIINPVSIIRSPVSINRYPVSVIIINPVYSLFKIFSMTVSRPADL